MAHQKTKRDIQLMDDKELAEFLKAKGFEKCQEVFIRNNITGAQFLSYKEVEISFLDKEIKQELKRLWKFRGSLEKSSEVFRDRKTKSNQSFKDAKTLFENFCGNSKVLGRSRSSVSSSSSANIIKKESEAPVVTPAVVLDENTIQSNSSFLENRKKICESLSQNLVEPQSFKGTPSTFQRDSKCIIPQNSAKEERDEEEETPPQVRPVLPPKPSQNVCFISKDNNKREIQELPTSEKDLKSEENELDDFDKDKTPSQQYEAPPIPSKTFLTPSKNDDLIPTDSEVQTIKESEMQKEKFTHKSEEVPHLNPNFLDIRRKISAHLEDRLSLNRLSIQYIDEVEIEVEQEATPKLPPKKKVDADEDINIEEIETTAPPRDETHDVNIRNDSSMKEILEKRALTITNEISATKSTAQELYIEEDETPEIDSVQETDNLMYEGGYAQPPPVLKPRKDPAIPTREEQVPIEPEPDLSNVPQQYLDKIRNMEKNGLFKAPEPPTTSGGLPMPLCGSDTDDIKKNSQKYKKIIDHPAFMGIPKQKCLQILSKAPKGSYILYESAETSYALMVKTKMKIHNIPIVLISDFFQIQFEIDKKKDPLMSFVYFDSLIEHYKKNQITMGGEKFCLSKKNSITL